MLFLIIAVISVSVSDLICYRVLKPLIKRTRPSVELKKSDQKEILIPIRPLEKKHYSMPSNHASNIFAFFTVYFLFVRKYWSFLLLNSVIIAFSRITLVKHYPTDVLAGIAVGIVTGLLTYSLFSLLDNRFGFREKLETS